MSPRLTCDWGGGVGGKEEEKNRGKTAGFSVAENVSVRQWPTRWFWLSKLSNFIFINLFDPKNTFYKRANDCKMSFILGRSIFTGFFFLTQNIQKANPSQMKQRGLKRFRSKHLIPSSNKESDFISGRVLLSITALPALYVSIMWLKPGRVDPQHLK